ncbi:MAG: polymerase [Tissierellia bacterium]|nr:polymerase [Tissierellia bacterium]
MVVDSIRKRNILPIAFGIIFLLLYWKLPLKYFASLLIGFLGFISILKDIRIGVLVSIITLPFWDYTLNLIFMGLMVGVYLFEMLFKGVRPLEKEPMDIPIILFIIFILISTITSIDIYGSFRDLAFHLTAIGFIFVLVNTIKTKKDFNILITCLIIAAALVGIQGLLQYKEGVKMEAGWVDLIRNPEINIRIYSAFGNPNILAEYLVMTIPISLALFWYSKRLFKKIFFFATTIILLLSLMLTLSRGGWLGMAFGALIFALLVERRLLLLAIPLATIMVYTLPERIFNRLLSIWEFKDFSSISRVNMWQTALGIIHRNWLIGVGFGYIPFRMVYSSYAGHMGGYYHIHNTYLQTLGETGIVGLIILIFLIFTLFKYSIKRLIGGEDRYAKVMAGGLLAGLAGILFHGLVENILYMPKIIATFWIMIGLLLILLRIADTEDDMGQSERN